MTLTQAIALAKLQEEKINDQPQTLPNRHSDNFLNTTHKPSFRPALTTQSNTSNTAPAQSTIKTPTPIKKLSPTELQARDCVITVMINGTRATNARSSSTC